MQSIWCALKFPLQGFTGGAIATGVIATPLLWIWRRSWDWDTLWAAVGAIATLLGVLAIRCAVDQLRFAAWLEAQEVFTDKAFVEARERVFAHFDDRNTPWPVPEGDDELTVCRKMNEMAHLFPFVGQEKAPEWGNPIAKAWLLLEPTVANERKKSHWPDKWKAFETTGKKAVTQQPDIVEYRNTILSSTKTP